MNSTSTRPSLAALSEILNGRDHIGDIDNAEQMTRKQLLYQIGISIAFQALRGWNLHFLVASSSTISFLLCWINPGRCLSCSRQANHLPPSSRQPHMRRRGGTDEREEEGLLHQNDRQILVITQNFQ